MSTFYCKNNSSGQCLIIEEATGRTVAVCYDQKDGPLLSASHDMREALEKLVYMADLVRIDIDESMSGWYHQFKQRLHEAQMQIRKVREG
jgi:hypothetical protein